MQNIDVSETEKFAAMASHWWDPEGPCQPLHLLNPVRLQFITDVTPLHGKSVLDVGCGGGILTEALSKNGGTATGIDADNSVITTAKLHALDNDLNIKYECTTVEEFDDVTEIQFDVVTCMEMLEHVPDPASVIKRCAALTKPGGMVFFSTLNRTIKAYMLAVFGAEYVMNMLPKGTHDYAKFIKPHELNRVATEAELSLIDLQGLHYNPLLREFSLSNDVGVNYLCAYRKQGSREED